ncbi:hypothetical protein DVH24_014216 [Malus domestica]|uniref:Uncharacterized protein n=1 Tax=Malus domestica TaxID=3750 RepID=A0A498JDQ1_MALDO|nr:hypothetical protein DVH24_014216 [Malus domestica]
MAGEQVVVFYDIPFRNANCNLKYTNHFSNQPIVLVWLQELVQQLVTMQFCATGGSCIHMINVEGTTLILRVNGVDIAINPYVLAMIDSIP